MKLIINASNCLHKALEIEPLAIYAFANLWRLEPSEQTYEQIAASRDWPLDPASKQQYAQASRLLHAACEHYLDAAKAYQSGNHGGDQLSVTAEGLYLQGMDELALAEIHGLELSAEELADSRYAKNAQAFATNFNASRIAATAN